MNEIATTLPAYLADPFAVGRKYDTYCQPGRMIHAASDFIMIADLASGIVQPYTWDDVVTGLVMLQQKRDEKAAIVAEALASLPQAPATVSAPEKPAKRKQK